MIDYQTVDRDERQYESTDLDLISRVGIALTSRQRLAWRVIRVIADGGVVTLQGIVPSYYDRQVIVAVTQHVAGVRRVDDELTIVEPQSRREEPVAEIETESVAHGGSELKPEAAPTLVNHFRELPVLRPSLEEILAARAEGTPAEV
jgi:hypothetical protein